MTTARVAAGRALLAIERGHTTLAGELERARSDVGDPRDRGLLIELVAGTLRWQQELDVVLEQASRRTPSELDPPVRAVLRLGAYQIRHLERIPPHAIVNESVDAVRTLGSPRAAGFVNAVLRALLRGQPAPSLPARPGQGAPEGAQIDYLAVTLSHPRWLVRRWLGRYGFEDTERWCIFNNTAPSPTLRVPGSADRQDVLTQLQAAGIDAVPSPFVSGAIRLPAGTISRVPADLSSTLAIQDEGSQLVARFAAVRPGERVIDLCAAPGGKTTMMFEDLAPTPDLSPRLVACDYRPSRVKVLSATLRRRQLKVPTVTLDARAPLPFLPVFDCVLLDAPCSGLGTLRRDPDLKWSRHEAEQPRFVDDQRRMIHRAAELVRPGGRLVYATCSSEPEENDILVREFLDEARGDFVLGPPPSRVDSTLVDDDGCLHTLPHRHGLDAYFAARLVRRGTA